MVTINFKLKSWDLKRAIQIMQAMETNLRETWMQWSGKIPGDGGQVGLSRCKIFSRREEREQEVWDILHEEGRSWRNGAALEISSRYSRNGEETVHHAEM